MGTSFGTADDLARAQALRNSNGTSFGYTKQMKSAPVNAQRVHEMLDPKRINSNGRQVRECLDSVEHPNTIPIVVAFDETGSMGIVPQILQDKLAMLKGVTLRAGLPDAQIAFGAYGDAANLSEVAPVQIGHFESGLEIEEWLHNIYLEGNGGGNGGESSALLMWFLGEVSKLDSIDKRGKKGYLFLTGDEISHPIFKDEINHYLGLSVEGNISVADAIAHCKKKYDIYFLLINNSTAQSQRSYEFWSKHLGSMNVVVVEDPAHVSELISGIIAAKEGVVSTPDQLTTLLSAEGATSTDLAVVNKTLSSYLPVTTNTSSHAVVNMASSSGTLQATTGTSAIEPL